MARALFVQGTIIFTCPGKIVVMTPPQLHMAIDFWSRAGITFTITFTDPGTHGADTMGIQGIGTRTPRAAAVAAATMGLEGVIHMPNGKRFIKGLLSIILAMGPVADITILMGRTVSDEGAMPKAHLTIPPIQFAQPMSTLYLSFVLMLIVARVS